ncbi:TIGR02444 family protein [Pseudomonas sp. 7P_10.2_Bac1]|uniref:TIGR02444 family protein n=1 Tax=Pseudomonas sp. 7P_10.2_Bac1 TaxID=2971614 RepID=UPI0021CA174D|nr:TIGR02444 family protein [Pseudomonas sp. 7P_10.2_Bac1]MCU1727930.1 TIGR02444 family protein [Pseudomonas sp. 7P_10.2_Bac1]
MQTDLWNYCLKVYALPGIEHACLSLQSQGLDVCLLLCAAWLEHRRVACDEARFESLKACAEPWQRDVVQPLRRLRTQWREAAMHDDELSALRGLIKGLELEAERTLLRRLEAASQNWLPTQSNEHCDWLNTMISGVEHPDHGALQTLRAAINPA